jgi:glycosyltransferase involved in cell wall biosynthesis
VADKGTVNIFFFDGWLGVAPTVVNLAQCLAEMGIQVNVICRQGDYPDVDLSAWPGIRKVYLPNIDYNATKGLATFAREAARSFLEIGGAQDCLFNIGIDWGGGLVALLIRETSKVPYVYLSLEIGEPGSRFSNRPLLSTLDRLSVATADLLIIQDEDRLQALDRMYATRGLPHVLLPNSPRGRDLPVADGDFLPKRVGLDRSGVKTVVLYAGEISDTMYSAAMVRAFSGVSREVALICHDRVPRSTAEPYIKHLVESAPKNVFFSLTPVDLKDLPHVYASADIGVACYGDINENYALIAKASGKVGYYLKYGKPLIVNDLPSLRKFVEDFRCGVVIDDVASTQAWTRAIDTLLANYDTYSVNCRKAFREEFDFDASFARVAGFLDSKGMLARPERRAADERLMRLVDEVFGPAYMYRLPFRLLRAIS